jgi:hypothetical protein
LSWNKLPDLLKRLTLNKKKGGKIFLAGKFGTPFGLQLAD